MDISSVGCLAVWAFHVLGVKQIGYVKYLRSSSLGISSGVGCLAVWAFHVFGVKQIGHLKCWMSSRMYISSIGGKAD